jgi:hypothetical protein
MQITESSLATPASFVHALHQVVAESLRDAPVVVELDAQRGEIRVQLPRSHGHALVTAYRLIVLPEWPSGVV